MAIKKRMTKKKTKKALPAKGKDILFLHVAKGNKGFFRKVTAKVASKSDDRITMSIVADRMLTNIKKSPKLLRECLK